MRCTILLQSLNIEIRICYGGTRPWQRRPGGVQSGDLSRNCWIDPRLDASKGFREIPGSALIRYLDSMVKIAQRVDSTSKLDRLGRWIKFRGIVRYDCGQNAPSRFDTTPCPAEMARSLQQYGYSWARLGTGTRNGFLVIIRLHCCGPPAPARRQFFALRFATVCHFCTAPKSVSIH